MQPWDAIHPLLVHLPIGALAVVPVLIVMSIAFRSNSKAFAGAALAVLAVGTVGLYLAVSSGEAGGELVDRTPQINAVLEHHEELGEATRNLFTGLLALYAVITAAFTLPRKKPGHAAFVITSVVFLALYSAGFLGLANTGHEGAELVHKLGVRAMIVSGHDKTYEIDADDDLGLGLDQH